MRFYNDALASPRRSGTSSSSRCTGNVVRPSVPTTNVTAAELLARLPSVLINGEVRRSKQILLSELSVDHFSMLSLIHVQVGICLNIRTYILGTSSVHKVKQIKVKD